MKKVSNEVKVGIAALLTILVFIWLYNFLKGKDLFRSTANYYSVYEKVGGLAESSPVEINGYRVGVVQSISFIDAVSGRLLVEFSVDKNFKLPRNTVAEIVPVSLLGGMKVQFVYGKGPGTYLSGDTIPGVLAESIIDKVGTELVPVRDKLTSLMAELDSTISLVNDILNDDFRKNINGTLSNLKNVTGSLDNVLGSKEEELKTTLDNLRTFSQMLADNSKKLDGTFGNLEAISDTLAAADIYGAISNLKTSLENAAILINKLNDGKGTAGQLITNDTLYANLTSSMESLNALLKDLKANPDRYVHISVFGKKSTPAL
jgi:phospholipid/cholesterol/gamma-HCH transport system substrate-binding protein